MPSSRAEAWATLNEFTKSPHLVRHGLGVESAMRFYAPKYGGDPDAWGITGLRHDFDYQRFPEGREPAMKGTGAALGPAGTVLHGTAHAIGGGSRAVGSGVRPAAAARGRRRSALPGSA